MRPSIIFTLTTTCGGQRDHHVYMVVLNEDTTTDIKEKMGAFNALQTMLNTYMNLHTAIL